MSSKSPTLPLLAVHCHHSPPPSPSHSTSLYSWRVRQNWVSVVETQLGLWVSWYLLRFSFSPMEWITDWEGLSWHWAVPSSERGDTGKVRLFLLSCSTCPAQIFFFVALLVLLELLHLPLDFHKGSLVHGWLLKPLFHYLIRHQLCGTGDGTQTKLGCS